MRDFYFIFVACGEFWDATLPVQNAWKYEAMLGSTKQCLEVRSNTWKYEAMIGSTKQYLEVRSNDWKYVYLILSFVQSAEITGVGTFYLFNICTEQGHFSRKKTVKNIFELVLNMYDLKLLYKRLKHNNYNITHNDAFKHVKYQIQMFFLSVIIYTMTF